MRCPICKGTSFTTQTNEFKEGIRLTKCNDCKKIGPEYEFAEPDIKEK